MLPSLQTPKRPLLLAVLKYSGPSAENHKDSESSVHNHTSSEQSWEVACLLVTKFTLFVQCQFGYCSEYVPSLHLKYALELWPSGCLFFFRKAIGTRTVLT